MQANKFESTIGLKVILEKVDRLKSELDALRPLNEEQEARVMQKFRLDWNYHSNSIEGNSLTYGETIAFLMEGLTAKGKPFKDHLDIKGHNEAINYLMEMVKNRQHLTEKVIRELHEIILVEPYKTPAKTSDGQLVEKQVTLGAYKKMPNHVKTPTGEIHYYATPEETPAKMADLMAWLREHQEKEDLHPLIIAAVFHYQFVAIHPFDDGNGRMSRLLMNLLLMQYHYPPVVIRQEERNLYYNALRQADAGDLGAFVEFIGENLVHALEVYLRGARGESIEEEDDLDKEIALLKASFELESQIKIPKSTTAINNILENSIFILFNILHSECLKIADLFMSVDFETTFRGLGENREAKFIMYNLPDPKLDFQIGDWSDLNDVVLIIRWLGFQKNINPFDIYQTLPIKFNKYKYQLNEENSISAPFIEKFYHEQLTTKELKTLKNSFIKQTLAQINAHTQNKNKNFPTSLL